MKKLILFILIFISAKSFSQIASIPKQEIEIPVSWSTSTAQSGNTRSIVIKATINKGWHIFSSTPGGDGFLIPTEIFVLNKRPVDSLVANVTDTFANKKPTHAKIEGIGEVNYFENNVEYKVTVPTNCDYYMIRIKYQCCNDKMCLPPQDEEMSVRF